MKIRHLIIAFTAALLINIPLSIYSAQNNAIRVDMEGYRTEGKKYVMLVGQNYTSFTVKRVSDNATVFTGSFAAAINDTASGDSVRIGDFSSVTAQGDYYVQVTGLGESYNFRISDTIHTDVITWLMRGFYSQRCGTSVSLTHRGTTFSHSACHMNDATYDGSTGLSGIKNATGGWHDAGDYGKYALNSGITMGQILLAYERYKDALSFLNFGLSYSGGALPDYLAEAKWNIDWMLKMQHTNGGVFHKLSNGFPQGIMPNADTDTRYIFQISSAATGDFAAVMAIASRVYAPYDAAYSATCLAAAQNAWAFLQANPNIVPAGGFTGGLGGAYPDTNDSDERLWAAVELFNTTGNTVYNTYVAAHYNDRALTLMSDGGDDWKELHPLAYISYIQSAQPNVNATVVNAMKTSFQAHVDVFRNRVQSTNGYKYVLNSGDYYWGSNSVGLNRAIRLLAAADIFSDNTYKEAAEETLHYMLGRNPMNKSYLTYVGEVYTSNPHHQPSIADGITPPWPGLLAGGPNEYYDSGPAPAKCYIDDAGNYTSNEVAINWMAAYAYVLAAFVPTPGPTNTPTNTATSICYPVTCTFTNTQTPTMTATPISVLRVNVAGPQLTTGGNTWLADKAYVDVAGGWGYNTAGNTADRTASGAVVANTTDDMLYLTERWAAALSYTFNLANGWYLVTLKFNEMFVNSAGARMFNINMEGNTVQSSFDVYASAGNSQRYAVDRSYAVQVTDGKLNIDLNQVVEMCILNAIQVETYYPPTSTPTHTSSNTGTFTHTGTPTRTYTSTSTSVCFPYTCTFTNTSTFTATQTPTNTPVPTAIRVNCGGPSVTTGGFTWAADNGFTGGTAADAGAIAISNTTDDVLYQTERYGNPSYAFAVPGGYYNITFKFAETYWTSADDRIMDVMIEGITVINDLDIYASAVAPKANTAYDVTINNVLVTDGTINITSSASADVAKFCAIAIIPAGPPPTSTYTNTLVPTATNTSTGTHTFTSTYTHTYTATNTSTGTPTSTNSSTAVPPTSTNTPVNTNTSTNTVTFTNTGTYTATYTHTETQVPPTFTGTFTATSSATATSTNTNTYTITATHTFSNTFTITNTPPPGSTDTHTFTPTNTYTATHTHTNTLTYTLTETDTHTATHTNTASSTYTNTFTNTSTATVSFTPSETITTGGPTLTFTHTFTQTFTASKTHTATYTFTQQPSSTNTNTNTWTPSVTFTYTYTNTITQPATATGTFTYTATATFTAVITPTGTVVSETDKLKFEGTVLYPNPVNPDKQQAVYLAFTCNRNVIRVGYRIYTTSFRLVKEQLYDISTSLKSGVIGIPASELKKLANGTYYIQVYAETSKGDSAKDRIRQLIIIK